MKAASAQHRTVDLPALSLRADLNPSSINPESRTVEVVFSTGAPVLRFDWTTGEKYIETLSLDPKSVRLDRLNAGAPVLNVHDTYDLRSVLGVVEEGTGRVEKGRGLARLRFSRRSEVEPVWQDVRDRILRNVSVGYRVHRYEQTAATPDAPMRRHAVDWEPFEISAVPMPADVGAQIRNAAKPPQTTPCEIVLRRAEEMPTMDPLDLRAALETGTDSHQADTATATATAQPPVVDPGDPGAPLRPAVAERSAAPTERQAGVQAERKRVQGIQKAVGNAGFDVSLAERLIDSGVSLEQAQAEVLEELGKLERGTGPNPNARGELIREGDGVRVYTGNDLATKHMRAGIENALLHRMAPQFFQLDEAGRTYAGSTMLDFARYTLQAHGVRTTGMSKMEIVGWALEMKQRTGMHTTSDFANILADVANKTLRRAYDEAPQTFGPIVTRAELTDFKPVRRVQLGEAPQLEEVLEHGEFTRGTIGDAKEQYQLATFGRMFAITRQALVNDDTDAFSRLAVMFGRMARHKESDLVWAQLTSNPTMGDSVVLFHATHANLAGVAAAIAVASIGIGRAAMRQQTGLSGIEKLNISPRYLIVPTTLETIADQFVSVNLLASAASSVNPFAGRLTVISEPRLDAASTTAWYLAGSTDQIDLIELGFLAGEMGPVVESRVGWDVDGLEVKVRHDVAAKVIDWRGWFKNAGV